MVLAYRRWPSIAGLMLGIPLVASCSSDGNAGGTGPPAPNPPPMAVTVSTRTTPPARFIPANVRVAVGGTVTWRNTSPVDHDVTSSTSVFASGNMIPGQTFQFVFQQAGTFPYECTIHVGMIGTVTVE